MGFNSAFKGLNLFYITKHSYTEIYYQFFRLAKHVFALSITQRSWASFIRFLPSPSFIRKIYLV